MAQSMTQPLHKDRIVLVTGASRGIGAATALRFAQHGAVVAVNYYKSKDAAERVVAEIEAMGGKALAVQADVGSAEQVEAMVQRVEEQLGAIDTLALNATAVREFSFKPFLEYTWDTFTDLVLGELGGVYFPARAVAPRMVERKHGNIIAVSSTVSRSGVAGTTAHAAGKSGVDAFVRVLAAELGPYGIRVNAIAPGLVRTEATAHWSEERIQALSRMFPLRRVAQPEDVAGAIVLLASDDAGFITGNYISVSGGAYMQ
jgi:3-oxoacyl-[acyl-carrier protein] reductase